MNCPPIISATGFSFSSLRSGGVVIATVLGLLASVRTLNAAEATGTVEGRVYNSTSGTYVNNARVTIDALRLETFSDEYGNYRFPRVPLGDVRSAPRATWARRE